MGTSLAEQLRKLRAPQTELLLQDKKRSSLLFDPREAANLDRETVLNIGKSGLQDLIKLSNLFQKYEGTLFAQSSLSLERSVQDAKVNEKLDSKIEKFLILLSPYFLLNVAHKALEWLIHRFHIHQFNKDQFLMLILPYHETRMFVRALQLVDVSNPGDKWHWLKPLQKPGVPLSSITLVNRVASDYGLLKHLCNHVVTATKVYGDQATSLSTLYAFYTMSLIGAVHQLTTITEIYVDHMLPCLLKGLGSSISDFAAGSYMILAKLSTKVRINDETMELLMIKILKDPILKQEATLLLLSLYISPYNQLSVVPERIVQRLSEVPWFVESVCKVKTMSVKISKFLVPLLDTAFQCILTNSCDSKGVQDMVDEIFSRMSLEDDEVDSILSNALKVDENLTERTDESQNFLTTFYRSLERRYPTRFDAYLKNLRNSSKDDPKSKKSLQRLISWHSGANIAESSLDILDGLNHINPIFRIAALKKMSKGGEEVSEVFLEMVKSALLMRFNDDNVDVIHTLLNFPLKRLQSLFPKNILVEKLMVLLSECHEESRIVLAKPALKILLQLCDQGDNTTIFVAALPYLFPKTEEEVDIAMQVLQSSFAQNNIYLQSVKEDLGDILSAEAVASAAFHNILKWDLLPPASHILNAMKHQDFHGDASTLFFNMLLLGSVCRVPVGSLPPVLAREIIEIAAKMMTQYPKVLPLPGCNHLNSYKIEEALQFTSKGILPLQVGTYILEMVHRRLDLNANPVVDFEKDPERSFLILQLLQIIFEGLRKSAWTSHYKWCLEIFLRRHFSSAQAVVRFLSQFYIKPVDPQTSLHCLEISAVLLSSSRTLQWAFLDDVFVTNLLIALSSKSSQVRKSALGVLKTLSQTFNLSMEGYSTLLNELATKKTEIAVDCDQLPLALYTLLSPDPDVSHQINENLREKLQVARDSLLRTATKEDVPIHIVSQLLDVLVHVNGPSIVKILTPLGIKLLEQLRSNPGNTFTGKALKNLLLRFNGTMVEALKSSEVWEFFRACIDDQSSQLSTEKGFWPPCVILVKQIDELFFDSLGKVSLALQGKVLAKLVDLVTDCELGSVVTCVNRAVKRINVDASLIIKELQAMKACTQASETNSTRTNSKRRRVTRITEVIPSPEVVNSRVWRRGVTVLEFIQQTDNIKHEASLFPALFDLLRTCLAFEEQNPVEYTNQLLLSSIHHLASKNLKIPDAHVQVDLIAQCIRTSQNPQTHHHALMVLVELFKVADVESALHNIMPIFTFMGNTVLRQDDAYSIQIISKTIETVVPIVNSSGDEKHLCQILRVFVTSLPDIPEHRRLPLFVKLLQLLEEHLHLFYLLTFDSQVRFQLSQQKVQKASSERLEFALNISSEFPPKRLVEVCVKLAAFARDLPVEVDPERQEALRISAGHVFGVAKISQKYLDRYKYVLVNFLGAVLSAPEFVNRVALLSEEEVEAMKSYYDELIVELVILIQSASRSADLHQGKPKAKYWKVYLHHLYDALDVVNALLPNETFIASIKRLLEHDLLAVRKNALELLNARIQQKKFGENDREDLLTLIDPLTKFVKVHGKVKKEVKPGNVQDEIVQTAFISFKLLAKLLANDYPEVFKPILEMATKIVKTRDGPVLASAVLCVAELCSAMRVHAIQSLNNFLPAILRLLEVCCNQETPDVVAISIISALQKIVESIGNFLSLYLDQLLLQLSRLKALYTDKENSKVTLITTRLNATAQKLSNCIPLRVLLPAMNKTYAVLLSNKSYECIGPLMSVLSESFANVRSPDLKVAISDLAAFFLKVLQFREDMGCSDEDEVDEESLKIIVNVEESAGTALVALVLKLSETTFRPLYYRLYDWAARNPGHKLRNITFFRISANVAECLKSLFVLFAGHFLKHAALLLVSNNIISEDSQELTLTLEKNKVELIEAILLTLNRIFNYDAQNFVNQERFEALAQPLVDQIENTVGSTQDYETRAKDLIVPCIASFAGAIQDDSLHKQLVYQTLLKTRHTKPQVRNTALGSLVEIARKLGSDFMPLLPETVPFLAELLEDEDELTEKNAQNAVRTLEEILGEPLQKYF
ncbi:HEAT repeat-containing protein 1 [Orussus abietinus]|uniref:HEAT repeat-containing protein 1 n=1 Tax=Orussus abietinus TaxID=222816 RepID=UPI000625DCBE|nr:HEAT repeat-containing protein 1 [Orussus abietinus]XP_012285728.1 HEAT repeat-containing protein 1 [Orussus abietinus]XP_023288717.1 HEAT repeat-containing protein 1 [Orussus abietinus]